MSNRNKPVSLYDGNTLLAKFPSIANAAFLVEAQPAHIGKVASGIRTTAGGYGWKFTRNATRFSTSVPGILQVDNATGNTVAVYRDVEAAATLSGLSTSKIERVLSGAGKTVGGYRFLTA